jgi:1,4-alpha-glucan branching enzyme
MIFAWTAMAPQTASAKDKDKDTPRQEALEKSVTIVSGPTVSTTATSATIVWATNKNAATDVWLKGGNIRGHRTQYVRGGSTNHQVTFANLKAGTTYTYEVRTREGGDRKEGQLTTLAK